MTSTGLASGCSAKASFASRSFRGPLSGEAVCSVMVLLDHDAVRDAIRLLPGRHPVVLLLYFLAGYFLAGYFLAAAFLAGALRVVVRLTGPLARFSARSSAARSRVSSSSEVERGTVMFVTPSVMYGPKRPS